MHFDCASIGSERVSHFAWYSAGCHHSVITGRLYKRSKHGLVELACIEAIPSMIHLRVHGVVEAGIVVVNIHGSDVACLLIPIERLEYKNSQVRVGAEPCVPVLLRLTVV